MRVLAIETSCDETSAAILADGVVRANVVSSQIQIHSEYGGVVPELAAREHLRGLPVVIQSALRAAQMTPREIDVIAATLGPGLPQALLLGARAAQAFAFATQRPFVGIHHHEAHLYSPWISGEPLRVRFDEIEPHVSLIASGGHTLLIYVEGVRRHQVLGSTLDDAAGECFDKIAKLIGLAYPGGPQIDRLASEGDRNAFTFPRPLLRDQTDDFSFSGLKTSVRYFLEKNSALLTDRKAVRDLCASVQEAIVEVLVTKLLSAARRKNVGCVTASGGVICNRRFRERLAKEAAALDLRIRLASPGLCTDNAAMIAAVGELRYARGEVTSYDEEIRPSWTLEALEKAGTPAVPGVRKGSEQALSTVRVG